MKDPIPVTCALIHLEGRILAVQRSASMSHPMMWEFPGGKVEDGESHEACIIREIREELGVEIRVGEALASCRHDYGDKAILLLPFRAEIVSGTPVLHEHAALFWGSPAEIAGLDLAPADRKLLDMHLLD